MGILPLQYLEGESLSSLGLTGKELYSVTLPDSLKPRQIVTVKVNSIFLTYLLVLLLLHTVP